MWRNNDNIYPHNINLSSFSSEKQTKRRIHRPYMPTAKLRSNESDFLSMCIPLNTLKRTDKLCQIPKLNPGSIGCHIGLGQEELERGQANLDTIYELDGSKQFPLLRKTLPCVNRINYGHENGSSETSDLPYWKNADKEDLPIRTIFRANKWVDSDEQDYKLVSCLLECESISSKYSACSNKRIGMRLTQRGKVTLSNHQVAVCSCSGQKKREIPKSIHGNKSFNIPASEKSYFPKPEVKVGHVNNHTDLCFLNPSQKQFSGNGNRMKTVRVAAVESSKCFYLKQKCDSSYISSNNKLVFQNSAYTVPNTVRAHYDDNNSASIHLSQGRNCMKSVPPETFVEGTIYRADNLKHVDVNRHKPIDSQIVIKKSKIMSDSTQKLEESVQKILSEMSICEDTIKLNNCEKSESVVTEGMNEPKRVLDVLEVDTLAKANNILEKIANTLEQIKVLNESVFPNESVTGHNTMIGENASGGDEVKENVENPATTTDMKDNGKEKECKDKGNALATEIESMTCAQDEMTKVENSTGKEIFDDKNGKSRENKNSMKICSLEDSYSDDLNIIPLKITKAVSDFKMVKTNLGSDYKITNTQELKPSQEPKKSHSINIISQPMIGEKCKDTDSPKIKSPEEKLLDRNSSKENEKIISPALNETKCHDESDSLSSSVFSNVNKQSCSSTEVIDQKKISKAALETILEMALSPKVLPKKDILDFSIKGKGEKAETTKMNSSTSRAQSSVPPRLYELSQPKASYMKAVRREFKNLMAKPMLERLSRMIKPEEKMQSSCLSDSKPPVPPCHSVLPKRPGTPLRNQSSDAVYKLNATIDNPSKKPKLRPRSSPNKARDEVVTQHVTLVSPPAESLPIKPIDEKNPRRTEPIRPSSDSDDLKGPNEESARCPSSVGIFQSAADRGTELTRSEAPTEKRAPSPPRSVDVDEPRTRSENRGGVGQSTSEDSTLGGHLADDGSNQMRRKNKSLAENLVDGTSPTKRIRAKTSGRRARMVRPRRQRYATCCLSLPSAPDVPAGSASAHDLSLSGKADGAGDPNPELKKHFAEGSVNVSLTLKNESVASLSGKTEGGFVKSAKEANNQIIFNVYQVKMAPEATNDPNDKKVQREERGHASTPSPEEGSAKVPSSDNVEPGHDKPCEEVTTRGAEVGDTKTTRPRSQDSDRVPGGEELTRGNVEALHRNRMGGLPPMEDGGPVEGPRGYCEGLLRPPEKIQYPTVECEDRLASFKGVQVPAMAGTDFCHCGGCDVSSDACRAFTSTSQTEIRTESSVPMLVSDCVSEDCCETDVCTGCLRGGGGALLTSPYEGKALPRPLRETTLTDLRLRERLGLLSRRGQGYGEDSLRVAPPVIGTPYSGTIKDWLRDSGNWSNALSFKVDVSTSVSGFHVSEEASRRRGGRPGAFNCETRKDVACSTKQSSVLVMWEGTEELDEGAVSECCISKELKERVASPAVPPRSLALVQNVQRRKMAVMMVIYTLLYTFLGWLILLPTYYL